MSNVTFHITAVQSCTKTTTAGTITGFVILAAVIGAIVFFAVANSRARKALAAANAELSYLRPENARLHQWVSVLGGTPVGSAPPGSITADGYTSGTGAPSIPAQWYPDPSGRHEFRLWDGTDWTDDVADRGVTAKDIPN